MAKCSINGETINALSIAFANVLSKQFSTEELDLLAVWFELVGDALGMIVTTRSLAANSCKQKQSN